MVLPSATPELADLDLLLSVERFGSLGKAAKEHGISQPTASVRIQAVERRLGVQLLARSPSGSRLTPAGAMLLRSAQTAVDAVAELLDQVAILRDADSRLLRVAAGLTTVEYLIPRWLAGLHAQQSNVSVDVHAEHSGTVLERIRSGEADLGFVVTPCLCADLSQRVVGQDELVVVVAPEHPWARRQTPLPADELCAGRLVLRERGSGTRETLREALGEQPNEDSCLELPSTTAIKETVAEGASATVLSLLAVERELRAGWLVRVPVAGVTFARKLRAVWGTNVELSQPAKLLVEIAATESRFSLRRTRARSEMSSAGLRLAGAAVGARHANVSALN